MTNDEINRCAVLVAAAMEQNLIDSGWRKCAVGQRSTQFCSQVETLKSEWKQAVIDELINCHIYSSSHEGDPRKAVHDAICWNVEVALDPKVSSSAEELLRRGAAAEREACADICDHLMDTAVTREMAIAYGNAADAIRGRGER